MLESVIVVVVVVVLTPMSLRPRLVDVETVISEADMRRADNTTRM